MSGKWLVLLPWMFFQVNWGVNRTKAWLSSCQSIHKLVACQQVLIAKIDLNNAFKLSPIRREDWYLLGIHWRIDTYLPFGLCSTPYLFDEFATALHWILQNRCDVCHLLPYLQWFFTASSKLIDYNKDMINCTVWKDVCICINTINDAVITWCR